MIHRELPGLKSLQLSWQIGKIQSKSEILHPWSPGACSTMHLHLLHEMPPAPAWSSWSFWPKPCRTFPQHPCRPCRCTCLCAGTCSSPGCCSECYFGTNRPLSSTSPRRAWTGAFDLSWTKARINKMTKWAGNSSEMAAVQKRKISCRSNCAFCLPPSQRQPVEALLDGPHIVHIMTKNGEPNQDVSKFPKPWRFGMIWFGHYTQSCEGPRKPHVRIVRQTPFPLLQRFQLALLIAVHGHTINLDLLQVFNVQVWSVPTEEFHLESSSSPGQRCSLGHSLGLGDLSGHRWRAHSCRAIALGDIWRLIIKVAPLDVLANLTIEDVHLLLHHRLVGTLRNDQSMSRHLVHRCWRVVVVRCWRVVVFRCWRVVVFRCWRLVVIWTCLATSHVLIHATGLIFTTHWLLWGLGSKLLRSRACTGRRWPNINRLISLLVLGQMGKWKNGANLQLQLCIQLLHELQIVKGFHHWGLCRLLLPLTKG